MKSVVQTIKYKIIEILKNFDFFGTQTQPGMTEKEIEQNPTFDSLASNIGEPKEAAWNKLMKETPPPSLEGTDKLEKIQREGEEDREKLRKQSQNESGGSGDSDIAKGAHYKDPKKQDVFEPGPYPQNQDGSLSQPRSRKK